MEEFIEHEFAALMKAANAEKDIFSLVELAHQDSAILKRCCHPNLEPLWQSAWAKMNRNPTRKVSLTDSSLKYVPLKPLPGKSTFLLFAGMLFFNRYESTDNFDYCIRAAQKPYYSFHALERIVDLKLAQAHKQLKSLMDARVLASVASKQYPCVGHILLANVAFEQGQRYQDSDLGVASAAYQCALQYLATAKHERENSNEEILYAYFGQGIKASNPWQIDTIAGISSTMQGFLQGTVIDVNPTLAEQVAAVEPSQKRSKTSEAGDSTGLIFSL